MAQHCYSNPPRKVIEVSQLENKAETTNALADYDDNRLFLELRRRGYSGQLKIAKVINL